ncbi:MAG: sugar transferase [Elusimicrobia bacterium]|nr:sugar transferase [Elusimicrobiota bacterium]
MPELSPLSEAGKRTFDLACAAAGLALLWPLLLAIAVLVVVDSPGPVFHRGMRSGRHGKPFRIYKFRTMAHGAESRGGLSTAKDDPRITRAGRFLRRFKLDELPQLLNVLTGEMSLVGPRPEMPEYTRLYAGEESLILTVRPGITDYSSLEFIHLGDLLGNDQPDRVYEEKVRPVKNALRVKYVRERSFLGDLWIILRTLGRLAGG